MPSTYTTNNGIEKIATGEQSGTWGDTTNVNFDLLDEALDGQVSVALTGTGTSSSPNDLEITDGTSSNGRNRFVEFTGTPGGTTYVRLTPNNAEKVLFIQNSTNQTLLLFQGTYDSGRDYPLEAGRNAVVRFTGGGTTSYAYNALEDLKVSTLETDILSVSDDSTGEVSITSTSVPTLLKIQSNEDGADGGPRIDLYRNSSSPADNDRLAQIYFSGEDDGGGKHQYAKIEAFIEDASAGSEDGRLNFNVLSGGSGTQMLTLRADTGGSGGEVVVNEPGDVVNFRVEGDTEPDLFVVDASNDVVVVGDDTARGIGSSTPPLFQVVGVTGATSSLGILRNQATSSGPSLRFARSRASTKGDTTIVQDDDQLGSINFYGADGTDFASMGAQIVARVDGTPGVDDMPGSLEFRTTADGSNSTSVRMIITSDGLVGLGSQTPSYELDIRKDGGASGVDARIKNDGTDAADNTIMRFQIGGTTANNYIFFGDSGDSNAGEIRYSHSDDFMSFDVNAAERLRITSDGSVGIGDSVPNSILHIETADTSLYSATSSTNNKARLLVRNQSPTTGSYAALSLHCENANSTVAQWDIASVSQSSNYDADLVFHTRTGSSSWEERMRMTDKGHIGLGQTTPRGMLHINGGGSTATPGIYLENFSATEGDITFNTGEILQIGTWNTSSDTFNERLTIHNNGDTNFYRTANFQIGRNEAGSGYDGGERHLYIWAGGSTHYTQISGRNNADGSPVFLAKVSNTTRAEIEANGDFLSATDSYGATSDGRLKENIADSGSQWEDIKAVQVKKYSFIADGLDAPDKLGVIAQDLLASGMSGLVKQKFTTDIDDNPVLDADGNQEYIYAVKTSVLHMKALKALQEAMERIETLETKVAALEAE